MKTFASILALLTILLFCGSALSAQTISQEELTQLKEERTVALFNMQNKHDIQKQKEMVKLNAAQTEKADLQNKRREVQVVNDPIFPKLIESNDPIFPKLIESNDPNKASWEYAQAKQQWVNANPEKYTAMMNGTSIN